MKVTSVELMRGESVTLSETEYTTAIRYSADNWMLLMGESFEPVYCADDLEAAYQKFKRGMK